MKNHPSCSRFLPSDALIPTAHRRPKVPILDLQHVIKLGVDFGQSLADRSVFGYSERESHFFSNTFFVDYKTTHVFLLAER
jgi:hypothetical protein